MSQKVWTSIDPTTTSGLMLVGLLVDFKDALMSGLAGNSRPTQLQAGGMWVDTTNQGAPNYYWAFKLYNGTTDVEIFRISILNGFGGTLTANGTFTTQKISGDTAQAIFELVKNRIANNAQILSGDVVGEVRFTGRTDTGTDPVCAYFRFTSTDNNTATEYGGTMTFFSTPDGSSAIAEHFRFINGQVETVTPLLVNSQVLVSQEVATTSSIVQLSASKVLVEMTGSTATAIRGINAGQDTKRIFIHNRSSAVVTLSHEDAAAVAADRLKLPSGSQTLNPEESALLFYSTAESRWKIAAVVSRKLGTRTIVKMNGAFQQWTAPAGVTKVRVTSHIDPISRFYNGRMIDPYGQILSWGFNFSGSLGVGDLNPRSSPTAVLGGLRARPWPRAWGTGANTPQAIATIDGRVFCWGGNADGQLGDGTVVPKSSPVSVLGTTRFSGAYSDGNTSFAITPSGQIYGWGSNNTGLFGVGDLVRRSSPILLFGGARASRFSFGTFSPSILIDRSGDAFTAGPNDQGQCGHGTSAPPANASSFAAVLGGVKWKEILIGSGGTSSSADTAVGLSVDGDVYCWGGNAYGQLGDGTTVAKSSPVAVIGGLKFYKISQALNFGESVFALQEDGSLYAWGYNETGILGLGDLVNRSSPTLVGGSLKFERLSVGSNGSSSGTCVLGITKSGELYSWGGNIFGQLGLGDTASRSSPVLVSAGPWKWVAPYDNFVFGCQLDSSLWSWGLNTIGQLGTNDLTSRSTPTLVVGPSSPGVESLYGSFEFTVVPGDTYNVVLSHARSTFGSNFIGQNIDNITIEYGT